MTTHKALLIQARDALIYSIDDSRGALAQHLENYGENYRTERIKAMRKTVEDCEAAIASLQEAIDAPEPYDQQALEPCPICGWKAIVPGEPCLMCERNARMLAPEPEPVAWIGVHVFDALKAGKCVTSTMTKHKAFEDDVQIFTRPPAVREPLSEDQIFDIAHANEALFDRLAIEYQSRYVIALFRAIEAAVRAKP